MSHRPRAKSPANCLTDPRILLLFWGSLTAIYSIVLLVPYAYLDDYYWLDEATRQPAWIIHRLTVQGRPLNGILLYWFFACAKTIRNLAWIRWLTLTGLAAMAFMFYRAMRRVGWPIVPAFLTALLACTLPACQVYAFWATSVPIPLGGVCAILAAILVGKNLNAPRVSPLAYALPATLMLMAATIYQPIAMVYFPVAALDLLRPRTRDYLRRGVVFVVVAAVGLFVDWILFKSAAVLHPDWVRGARAGFTREPLYKVYWFLTEPMVDSLNLIKLWPSETLAIAMAILLPLGLWLYFPDRPSQRLGRLFVAAALLPLSYLPNLLAEENWSSYRTQIGLSWLVLVLTVLALTGIWRTICRATRSSIFWRRQVPIAALAAATVFCSCQAAFDVARLMVWPQSVELSILKSRVTDWRAPTTTHIIFLTPDWLNTMSRFSRYDEIGRSSTQGLWVPYAAVSLLRKQMQPPLPDIPPENFLIQVNVVGKWPKPIPPGTVLIDMRDLINAHLTK
jgi:hypothetical protein